MKTKENVWSIVRKNIRKIRPQLFDRDISEQYDFAEDYGFDLIDVIELSEYCAGDLMIDVSFYDVNTSKTVGEFVALLCNRCCAKAEKMCV